MDWVVLLHLAVHYQKFLHLMDFHVNVDLITLWTGKIVYNNVTIQEMLTYKVLHQMYVLIHVLA